jgi:pyruvate formate lyase activating enzyme
METHLQQMITANAREAAPELVREEGDGVLRCLACGHTCRIPEGKSGICRMRFNENGVLLVPGGYVAGLNVDPIEKKPCYHVMPGCDALSFGMLGCNLQCAFCQNWVSSQALRDEKAIARPHFVSARQLVDMAAEYNAPVMMSTYNEPLITSDWAAEVFRLAKTQQLLCGYVSNGHASKEVLDFLKPVMEIFKVDLKCFSEEGYKELGGRLHIVLDTIVELKAMDYWVEIVTLIVPGFNDDVEELRNIAKFIASVSPDIPWHVTAFHPDYHMQDPKRTGPEELERAWNAGKEAGLHFVYAGNMPGILADKENTYCHSCGELLIRRQGFRVIENRMDHGKCPECATTIPGIWSR